MPSVSVLVFVSPPLPHLFIIATLCCLLTNGFDDVFYCPDLSDSTVCLHGCWHCYIGGTYIYVYSRIAHTEAYFVHYIRHRLPPDPNSTFLVKSNIYFSLSDSSSVCIGLFSPGTVVFSMVLWFWKCRLYYQNILYIWNRLYSLTSRTNMSKNNC